MVEVDCRVEKLRLESTACTCVFSVYVGSGYVRDVHDVCMRAVEGIQIIYDTFDVQYA